MITSGEKGCLSKYCTRTGSLEHKLLATRLEASEMHLAFQDMMKCANGIALPKDVLSDLKRAGAGRQRAEQFEQYL